MPTQFLTKKLTWLSPTSSSLAITLSPHEFLEVRVQHRLVDALHVFEETPLDLVPMAVMCLNHLLTLFRCSECVLMILGPRSAVNGSLFGDC